MVFKLLYFGKNPVENPANEIGITMNFQSFTEIPASIFGNNSEFYVLVRPDNHISYIGKNFAECKSLIDKIRL